MTPIFAEMCFGPRHTMDKNNIEIRNYRWSDFDDYVQLHMETNKLDRSGRSISKQRLAEDLGHPSFQPENDLFVAEHGGSIIGYAAVFLEAAIKRAILECMIHPLHRKKGIATKLIGRAIRHAEAAVSKVAQANVPEINLPARNLMSRLGFKFIRHFYELKLDLNNIRLPDFEPSGYIIRSLEPDEADKLKISKVAVFYSYPSRTPITAPYALNFVSLLDEQAAFWTPKCQDFGPSLEKSAQLCILYLRSLFCSKTSECQGKSSGR